MVAFFQLMGHKLISTIALSSQFARAVTTVNKQNWEILLMILLEVKIILKS
jgi:hypothetical protein